MLYWDSWKYPFRHCHLVHTVCLECELLRVRIVARHVCAPGFVVEASIFLTFSQFHHSGNAQIIGAPCEDLHQACTYQGQFNNGEKGNI